GGASGKQVWCRIVRDARFRRRIIAKPCTAHLNHGDYQELGTRECLVPAAEMANRSALARPNNPAVRRAVRKVAKSERSAARNAERRRASAEPASLFNALF